MVSAALLPPAAAKAAGAQADEVAVMATCQAKQVALQRCSQLQRQYQHQHELFGCISSSESAGASAHVAEFTAAAAIKLVASCCGASSSCGLEIIV